MALSTMTLLEAGGEVDRILGNREDDATFALAKAWVRRAHQDMSTTKVFKEAIITAAGVTIASTQAVALPADFFSIYSLRDTTNKTRLVQVSNQRFDSFDNSLEGVPTHYTLSPTTMELWRTPDAIFNLQIRYRKRLAPMTADGATTLIGPEWDQILIFLAAAYGFYDHNETERAQSKEAVAARMAKRLNTTLDENLQDRDEATEAIGLYGAGD